MSYPVFRAPGAPVDPNSSAAKIAATVGTAEAPQDWRLRNGSPAEHRRNELTAALRERGLGHHVDASALQRVLQHAPGGDAAEVADMIVERNPSCSCLRLSRPPVSWCAASKRVKPSSQESEYADLRPVDDSGAGRRREAGKARRAEGGGLSPRTAQSVIDEMLEVLDVDRLPGTVAEVKRRWSAYFPPPRSADVIASRTRR